VDERKIRWVAAVANHFRADAVMVVGLNVLPYLGGVKKALRVWYAADEWVWHHISQVKTLRPSTWNELKPALVKGLYERAYRSLLDRVWVVSKSDAKAFRWFAGIRNVDIMPNGVDAEFFAPGNEPVRAKSAVFWGRLDFGPNIQAIEWFCTKVWPKIRIQMPDASFSIYGFQPTPAVTRFAGRDGVTVTADLPDIRSAVRSHAVVVLPFVSGGGIKNKLLEAAGMAMPIICTSRVSHGLKGDVPFSVAHSTHSWVSQLKNLWQDEAARQSLGVRAREWVLSHHTWNAAARTAMEGLRCAKGVPT
jgi:glycosyltransferase involved in cell wall biosynthesis